MARLKAFSLDRAKTDTASTSRLSPHVHYGEISVRHIYYVVRGPGQPVTFSYMSGRLIDGLNIGACMRMMNDPRICKKMLVKQTHGAVFATGISTSSSARWMPLCEHRGDKIV